MVHALGLAPASENLPDTGGRLLVSRTGASLHYGHPMSVLRLPHTSRPWIVHAALGGSTVIALGLDPIPPGSGRDAIEEYLHRSSKAGRLYTGATRIRRRWA
ncbi:hypothetical protein [Streptomyces sp. NPDC051079]|uniref:hypothetical protein n=1 Tax=Streptomyces sp. NPDC051079 TaxID=3155043 RepID=UPI00344DBFC0